MEMWSVWSPFVYIFHRRVGWQTWSSFWFALHVDSLHVLRWKISRSHAKSLRCIKGQLQWGFPFKEHRTEANVPVSSMLSQTVCVFIETGRDAVGQLQLFNTRFVCVFLRNTYSLYVSSVANASRVQSLPQRKTLCGSHIGCDLGKVKLVRLAESSLGNETNGVIWLLNKLRSPSADLGPVQVYKLL